MEHPKDVGDRSTLAILTVLRELVRRDYRGDVDHFAVYCPERTAAYLIPIADLPLKRQAHLRVDPPRNNQRRGIRFAADYEIERVAIGGLRASSGA
jgi:hypothetical protein